MKELCIIIIIIMLDDVRVRGSSYNIVHVHVKFNLIHDHYRPN